jgi:thioredoxin 1
MTTTTKPHAVTDATFDQHVTQATGAVLVEFTADWCPPCRALAPILDEIAREQAGRLAIVTLNVDENPRVTAHFGVMSFPTMILFRDGQPVKQLVGARPKGALMRELTPHLAR